MKHYQKEKKSIIEIVAFVIYCLLSIPKTVYFNLKTLPLKSAIRLPILVGWNVELVSLKGKCVLHCYPETFLVRIGHGGSKTVPATKSIIRLRKGSVLGFVGKARFSAGTVLDVGGVISVGKDFTANTNAFISCENELIIGDDVLVGWDVHIFDNDGGHKVLYNGKKKSVNNKIVIGNHVWLCSYSHVLKGSTIMDGSILGYKSLLTKPIMEKNALIVGSPAEIKQKNIEWQL